MTAEENVHIEEPAAKQRSAGRGAPHSLPPPSLLNRLRYARTIFMTGAALVVLGPIAIIHAQIRPGAATFKRWARRWAAAVLWAAGLKTRMTVLGRVDPGRPYVFVSNHQSSLDILVLARELPYPFGFLAKLELKKVPLLGYIMEKTACLFVDRSSPKASLRSLREAGRRIREGNSVLVFPEGSRSRSPEMLPFKRGAFVLALEAGVPVVPVVIRDSYKNVDDFMHALVPGTIHLAVGDPVDVSRFSMEDSAALADLVHERMRLMKGDTSAQRNSRAKRIEDS